MRIDCNFSNEINSNDSISKYLTNVYGIQVFYKSLNIF